jgi:hypothetical protein
MNSENVVVELTVDPKFAREEIYEVPTNPPHDEPGGFPLIKGFTPGKKYTITKEILDYNLPREIGVLYMVKDDQGEIKKVPHHYFSPLPKMDPKFQSEFKEPVVNVRELHDDLKEKNQLTSSGIPDVIFDFYKLLREVEVYKSLCGVKPRRQLSLVAIDKMQAKVRMLCKLADEMTQELGSMRFELSTGKEEE